MELIYEIIGDIPRVETVKGKPELTSDHENCRPDISDRCGRPRASALEADEGYLFIDYIYSTSYDTTLKRSSSVGLLGPPSSSAGDMETSLVRRVPQPLTSPGLFVEDSYSALVLSVPLPPATLSLPENMFVFG